MATLKLTNGHVAQVSRQDLKLIRENGWKYRAKNCQGPYRKPKLYAIRDVREGGKHTTAYLHRDILGDPRAIVDHKNGDTLDCRRRNLKLGTYADNNRNIRRAA